MQENNSKKTLFKFAIPTLLIIVLIVVITILNPFGWGKKPTLISSVTSSSKVLDVNATTKAAPENKVKLSNKELEKQSQQFNSLLKQKRSAKGAVSGKELEFNWSMGWWDVEGKKACGIDIPKIPSDAGSAEIPKTIRELIPAPEKPVDSKTSRIVYPEYNVDGPIVYPNVKDQFLTNPDGTINFNQRENDDSVNSPIQLKLREGATLLPISPNPGDIGNSYIEGHTSNYSYVASDWNLIFAPFKEKSEPGETFFIYDCQGRKLVFKVFEAKEVIEPAGDEAWKDYPDKRVVTLQGSVLKTRKDGKLYPDARWLTRGELDLEATKKANGVK
jgi:hypothetical protein